MQFTNPYLSESFRSAIRGEYNPAETVENGVLLSCCRCRCAVRWSQCGYPQPLKRLDTIHRWLVNFSPAQYCVVLTGSWALVKSFTTCDEVGLATTGGCCLCVYYIIHYILLSLLYFYFIIIIRSASLREEGGGRKLIN